MVIHVSDFSLPELDIYRSCNESQLKHLYEPEPGIFIAETVNVILRALDAGYEPVSLFLEEKYLNGCPADDAWEILARCGAVPVYAADLSVISAVSGFKQSRGILCAMRRKPLPSVSEVLAGARRVAVLEDVENPTNVGALFRSAAALGMEAVILSFGCADPLYRRAARVSMGGVFRIPWTFSGTKHGGWPEDGMRLLKEEGFATAAMALCDRSVGLRDLVSAGEEKIAVLFGNEENGLLPRTLQLCDYTVRIPMRSEMDSLNVAAAAAVAFWELGTSR